MSDVIPIDAQIACIERELGFREKLYPRWVKGAKLTQARLPTTELSRMRGVLLTLQRVQRGQDHHVPDAAQIRAGAEARVICALMPLVPSNVMGRLQAKLARPS
jgi:hypothetical protein